jgi:hypothetical protein
MAAAACLLIPILLNGAFAAAAFSALQPLGLHRHACARLLPCLLAGEEGDRTPISAAVAMCNPFNLVSPTAACCDSCWLLSWVLQLRARAWLLLLAGAAATAMARRRTLCLACSSALRTHALPTTALLQPMSDTNFQKGFNKIYDWNLVRLLSSPCSMCCCHIEHLCTSLS